MKYILFLIAFLYGNAVFADSLSDYYNLINEAELLISSGKPDLALEHYNKAFELNKKPLGKDIYNAWVCAFQVDNIKLFTAYSTMLIKHGAFTTDNAVKYTLNDIKAGHIIKSDAELQVDYTVTDGIKSDSLTKGNVKQYFNKWVQLKQQVKSEIDTAYQKKLQAFLDEDQERRHYFSGIYGNKYNSGGRDSLNIFDSINIYKLKDFFKNEGFAVESKAGYYLNFPGNGPSYQVVLSHDRSWTNRKILDTLLYQKVISGDFPPQVYAILKDQSYYSFKDSNSLSLYQSNPNSNYYSYNFTVLNDTLYQEKYAPYIAATINASRKSIYLESLDDMYAKAAFQFSHNYYQFLLIDLFAYWNGMPEAEQQKTKANSFTPAELKAMNTIHNRTCAYGLQH